jgi:integrase
MAPPLVKTSTPGIYKRGSRYVVVWRHRGQQHKSFHRTLAEAREAKGERQSGKRRPATKQPFDEYARAWLEGYQGRTARGFGDDTRDAYGRAMELYAIPFFERFRLCDIEQPDVRRFIAQLQDRGLTATSIRKYAAPLKAMFATAAEDGDLPYNPTLGVRINARRGQDEEEHEQQAKAMTRVELAAVLAALEDRWRLLFELLAHTGLRISELLGLDWEDLVFGDHPRLRVRRQFYRGKLKPHPKSDAGRRELPLSPGMARKLWAARPAHASGPIFTTANGTRLADRNLRRVLDRASAPAGVPWIGFHTFRHTCASMLLESGKNIRQVAAWLGHTDPAFTLRTYTHLMDDGLGDVAFLDAAVGNARATEHRETAANDAQPLAGESAS